MDATRPLPSLLDMPARSSSTQAGGRVLTVAARSWFVVALLGQLMFVVYLLLFYGRASLQGDFAAWNKVLARGYVPGDTAGNLVLGLHLLFAVIITVGGALQFIPTIRRRWPRLHRWNGRLYLMSALLMAIGGLALVWVRGGVVGDLAQHLGTSLNAVVIVCSVFFAFRHARARRFDLHRRWAVRLFLAVSGVWFFRIGLSLWLMVNQGPAGFDMATFSGPFLTALAFGQTLVPLAMAELYFRAERGGQGARMAVSACLIASTLLTAAGVAAAIMILWWPRV